MKAKTTVEFMFSNDHDADMYKGQFEPTRDTDAARDLRSAVEITLAPGQQEKIDSGVRINISDTGIAAMIIPRSGTGSAGLVLGNSVGLIDCGYQGPLYLTLWNRSSAPIKVNRGDRVAQLIFVPLAKVQMERVSSFIPSERGEAGFGSSGVV